MISLDDVVLRDDLDPRLGQRDDDLIAQYAEIFDGLPPIEINQKNELVDGWHRVRAAEEIGRTEIAYVVVETEGDDDLGDRMWAANLKHGVQYTRVQRQTQGLKLYQRRLTTKDIAGRVGVSAATVRRWTKDQRERDKHDRNDLVIKLAQRGIKQAEIAKETGVPQRTVSDILSENVQMRETAKEVESLENTDSELKYEVAAAQEFEVEDEEARALPEETALDSDADETRADEPVEPAQESESEYSDETSELEAEPAPPDPIPDDILNTARAVMVGFVESRPDAYVARLEVSANEWMTITDDSLSNELERELLTSAAAMCLWQEWMIWYRGERTKAFTDAFGKIGPVFVRGQAGQWKIVSRLRSILRRIWA